MFYRVESVRSDTQQTPELETKEDGQLQTIGALEAKETREIRNKARSTYISSPAGGNSDLIRTRALSFAHDLQSHN